MRRSFEIETTGAVDSMIRAVEGLAREVDGVHLVSLGLDIRAKQHVRIVRVRGELAGARTEDLERASSKIERVIDGYRMVYQGSGRMIWRWNCSRSAQDG